MVVGAVILAAGLSSRMGNFKPLLSIGPRTLLGHTIHLFQASGVEDIVVVKGHQSEKLAQELDTYHCRSVLNENYTDGMFSSVQAGVNALSTDNEAFFLLPVDIPLVRQNTVAELLQAMGQDPATLVFYPEYRSRRGHPPLVRCDLVPEILNSVDQGGLQALLKNYRLHARNIPVADPYILADVDTPDDLVDLQGRYS